MPEFCGAGADFGPLLFVRKPCNSFRISRIGTILEIRKELQGFRTKSRGPKSAPAPQNSGIKLYKCSLICMEVEPELFCGITGACLSVVGSAEQQHPLMLACHAVCPQRDEFEGANRQTEKIVEKRTSEPEFVFHQAFRNNS